ncbi:DEAD/DEAH box helicase family protein [Streptomyces sp. NPDC051992]|uniref:DEAD/DEAH box helicase family protein n=1 Tax=Streptomyces sp. NPDC051992 TaxID=3161012 RepID=UPI0034381F75
MSNPVETPVAPAPEPGPGGRLGPIGRARASLTAIETLLRLRMDESAPTPEDLAALRHWPGWGPLAPALAENREGTWAEIGEELQRLLSPREYRQAEQGTPTAYYTPDRIADACWTALRDLGFRGGRILEPGCGAGTFINHTPDRMPVQWFGVERDPTTAGIAALLHPDAEIINARLQDAGLQSNSVDAVLGNVPYGNFQVHDKTAPKAVTDSIHNYFIWRSVQALRPGGVAILLTSRYTMDSADDTARRAIAKHADLLGAVRLPNGALAEGGTGVLADILIVRRRDTDGPLDDSWMEVSEIPTVSGQYANNYFLEHPENVLGEFEQGRAAQYGHTLAVKPPEGQDLAAALGTAFDGITAAARDAGRDWRVAVGAQPFTEDTLPFPVREDGRKEGSFHLVDGKAHEVVDGELVAVERAGKELPKLIALRDATVKLIEAETDHDTPDAQLDPLRAEVNRLYDAYVRVHGPINRFTLAEGQVDEETGEKAVSRRYPRLGGFRRDPDVVSVLALEDFDDETQKADKAPLLLRRVNRRIERPTSAETPEEALSLCLNFKNKIDVPTIAQLLGIEESQVPGALGELVFPDPDNGELLTRGAYLSGPVVDKLERAEFLLSQGREDVQRHVDELRKVQPEPLAPEDIKAKLGAPWIPVEDVTAFAEEMLGVQVDILHVARTATWNVDMPMTIPEAATSEWGTSRVNAFELLDLALNGQAPKVYDTFRTPDGGSRRVRNDKETMLAESKMTALMRRFASWVWEDPDRADRLAADYNRIFNSTVLPKHDGSHLTVDGMDPEFKPYEHQWDFVQRVLSAEEGSLCPYPVGAGKTATMFMTATKLKQLGLVNKPMIVVPNHLLEQISRDGKKLFPNARILMAGKKDLADARSRMLFAARCATGDWDAIVMTHNSFGRLGVHPVTEATYLEELANEYRVALSAIDGDDANQRRIKEIAKMVDRFDARASDLRSKSTDAGVTYENLGVDFIQVDEAHLFKNLALPATTEGMSLGKPSKRATDLDLKLIVTRERTGRDNVTALYSGTFISNSVREMYVFKHYTMPKRLEKLGVGSPDAWAANFIQFESRPEVGVDGVSFRLKRRPVEYTNADEALAMFAEVAELRPREEFKIKRPKRADRFVEIDATPNLVQYVGSISDRIDQIQSGKVKPFEDNMLNVITDGRKAALDLELVGMEPDGPGKAGAIIRNVLEIHERTKDLKLPGDPDDVSGGLQLVFCDLGTPSKERGSQVYGKVRKGLIDGLPGLPGIPRERIRFIHDYNSDLAKEQLFTDARSGKVSVLFMSSEKGGTGVNVQTRGVALHHADPPHKPAEWEQREGRLDRPGNLLIDLDMEVEFLRYIALNSFDSYMFQQLERKQRPIVQIMSGRKVGRVIQEIDPVGAGFGQAKAVATGNPMLLELADVNGELTMLLNEADGHRQSQARMRRKVDVLGDQISDAERTLPAMRAMADTITAAGDDETWRTADGRLIDPDDVAGVLAQTAQGSKPTLDLDAGYRWRGLNVGFTWHRRQQFGGMTYEGWAHLVAEGHQVDVRLNLSWFGKGQSWRIVKALGDAADEAVTAPAEIEQRTAKQRAALEDTRSHIGRPFEKHAELEAVRERKAALEERISGAAIASGNESQSGPQFDPGAAGADGGREMTEAEMAMHDAAAMAGMLGGTAVVVSEGQIIGGARVIDHTGADIRTPDLADLGQYQEALRALVAAAAADENVTARARNTEGEYGNSGFREALAEWAQDWALERANLPEDRPAWLRDWLEPESADTRQMLIGEAAWIVWEQARATEPEEAPPTPQDTPAPEAPTPAPEPVPASGESAEPPVPPQAGPQEPAPPTTPEAPAEDMPEPAPAPTQTETAGQTAPPEDPIDFFGGRIMIGHIGGPQPARTHQSAGWAITAVLSDDQVRGLVSAVAVDGQPVSMEPGVMPTDRVREWIAEQQQAPTTAFYASTSSELPPAVRGDGDVHLSTRADGLTIEQGDVTTTILWEELPAWIDAAVAHNTANHDPNKPAWRYGNLSAEIHFRRDERNRAIGTAMDALSVALRETVPPTDEQLAEARDRYAPPAAPVTTADAAAAAAEDAPAEESEAAEESGQLPEDAVPVPGAEGYHYTEEGRTVRLYTETGEEVGTAKWSYSKYRYLGDVQGDTVRGTEDGATVAKRMSNHHAVVYGDKVYRPTLDDQGRDPVWILHNGSDTLVFGVSPEDDTAKAAMWTGGGFKESRKVGGWYLPRTWKEPTRRQRVDDAVRVLAAAGRTVTAHTTREERQQPPQRPARLPELVVTPPNLDEVPQFFNAAPFTDQDDLADVQRMESAYARWGQHPTVRAYLQQDSDARPDGFGTPDNPIAELHIAYHRARLALREPVPGGPDEIVRRVYGVAAWCQALEPVVERDLLDPLQDVYAAAHGLAARSQATIAALTAEQTAAAEDAPAPAPAPEQEAPAATQQEPGTGDQPGEPAPAPSETAPAAAAEEQGPADPGPADPEPPVAPPGPAPDDGSELPVVSDEFAILYASYRELVPAGVADDGVTWDTSRIVITGDGVRVDGPTAERLLDAGLLEYGATLNVDITPAGRRRINELERTDRAEPAVGDRVLWVATGRLGIVGGYADKEHRREAEVVFDRDGWPNGWDMDIAPLYLVTIEPGAMEPEAAAEAYRVAALRQFPDTLTDPALRAPAIDAFTVAALEDSALAETARNSDLNDFVSLLASWMSQRVQESWGDRHPDEQPDWVRAYLREGNDAVEDRNGLYAELAGPLYAQLRPAEPDPAPAPDSAVTEQQTAEAEPEANLAPASDAEPEEQLDLFGGDSAPAPQETPPGTATGAEAPAGDDLAQLARVELTGAADIRYWMHGSMRPGEPETMRFHLNRQTRSYSFSESIFNGTRDECLAYIESAAAVRSAAEALDPGDTDGEQQAAAQAWLREAALEDPAPDPAPAADAPETEAADATVEEEGQLDLFGEAAPAPAPAQRPGRRRGRREPEPAVSPGTEGAPDGRLGVYGHADHGECERCGTVDTDRYTVVLHWMGPDHATMAAECGPCVELTLGLSYQDYRSLADVAEARRDGVRIQPKPHPEDDEVVYRRTAENEWTSVHRPTGQRYRTAKETESGYRGFVTRELSGVSVGTGISVGSIQELTERAALGRTAETHPNDSDDWVYFSYGQNLKELGVPEGETITARSTGARRNRAPLEHGPMWDLSINGTDFTVEMVYQQGLPGYDGHRLAVTGPENTSTRSEQWQGVLEWAREQVRAAETEQPDAMTVAPPAVQQETVQSVPDPEPEQAPADAAAAEESAAPDDTPAPDDAVTEESVQPEQEEAVAGEPEPTAVATDAVPAVDPPAEDLPAETPVEEEAVPAVDVEDPPAPRAFTETAPLTADARYQLRLTSVEGEGLRDGELLYGEATIAAVRLSADGRWFARTTIDGSPADVTSLNGSPQDAAHQGAIMFAVITGEPYGEPPVAADARGRLSRADVLRVELRTAAEEHLRTITVVAARANPNYPQNPQFQALSDQLGNLRAADVDNHDSRQMAANLTAVQEAVIAWGGALPQDPALDERQHLAFPLMNLLHETTRLHARLQATLEAVQADRAAAREQEAAAVAPAEPARDDSEQQTPAPTADPAPDPAPAPPVEPPPPAEPSGPERDADATEAPPTDQPAPLPDAPEDTEMATPARPATPESPEASGPDGAAESGEEQLPADMTQREGRVEREPAAEPAPPAAAEEPELPLWTGPAEDSGPEEDRPLDVFADFAAVREAWDELVPAEKGTGADLFATVEDELQRLETLFADAVAKLNPPAEPQPAPEAEPALEAEPAPASATEGQQPAEPAAAPAAAAPAEPEKAEADRDPQQSAEAVNTALREADAHAPALQDLPEWQRIQSVRGAFGHLMHVMKERAGEHFGKFMADSRVSNFVRRLSIAACEGVAGWAQAAADKLRGPDERGELPSAEALLRLGDAALDYRGPRRAGGGTPPSTNGAADPADIPAMRKMGEALNKPLPGAKRGVSAAAARGRSTTTKRGKKPAPGGSTEQAGHLRRGGAEQPQARKPTQR